MSRWEPDARSRLERASLELFVERGYDNTTVAEIAERAGLTKRTFFRHFADKREVLFGGQAMLSRLFIDAIVGSSASALDAVGAALRAIAPMFGPERIEFARWRQTIIAEHPDLQERELLKASALTAAMIDGFRERGLTDLAAHVAAELGQIAFRTSFARWVDPANERDFADVAQETLDELKTATQSATSGH